MHSTSTSLKEVKGIGDKTFHKLSLSGLTTVGDLLAYYPRRHEIYRQTTTTNAKNGEFVILFGRVKNPATRTLRNLSTQTSTLEDIDGTISLRWFNQPYLSRTLKEGLYEVRGQITYFGRSKQVVNPEVIRREIASDTYLRPIYSSALTLQSKWFEKTIRLLIEQTAIVDPYTTEFKNTYNLMNLSEAIRNIHFPKTYATYERAFRRLSFDELLELELSALTTRKQRSSSPAIPINKGFLDKFIASLPFQLTPSQSKSISEILKDMETPTSMERILVGDVGTGKTVVAAAAALNTHLSGHKTLILAPTQILAEQLCDKITEYLSSFGVIVKLITGKSKPSGSFDILVGTHAILNIETQQEVALTIVDEQHKLGVSMREKLGGASPHRLTMTATPIPRSLAHMLLGNTAVSYLEEKPSGRKPIKTYLVGEEKREDAEKWIMKELETGAQAFIVAPLIEESDDKTSSAKTIYQKISAKYPSAKLALLHGKLSPSEKTKIISEFRMKKTNLLVATTIVEVGIDIPNAKIMLIESAEKFGLSQLHQLRGRVGRDNEQGYCIIISENQNTKTLSRLQAFCRISDGAKLAEIDLKYRGPGELWGKTQHGFFNLKLASIFDYELVREVHRAAVDMLAKNPS